MANITSTTRPLTSGANIDSSSSTSGIATGALEDATFAEESTETKDNYKVPDVNQYTTPEIKQQAIAPDTSNSQSPTVVHENRYLYNTTGLPRINNTSTLSNSDRSDLSIFSRWANKLRATNNSNDVTTYTDDNASVPLLRRDTSGFFNVDYNPDGTFHVTSTGIRIPFTDTVVGNYDLGNFSWNPIKAYSVASPIGIYLSNYPYYDSKNKIIQGTLALSNAYSNYYDGVDNFIDNYAIKEWGNLVDMTANWKDRNIMQNAIAGLNTITGLSTRYGFNDYLGGDNVVGGINDTLALFTFGNSVYNLTKYWDKMSVGQQVGTTLSTINAGVQAYSGLKDMYGLYSKLSSGASATGTTESLLSNVTKTVKAPTAITTPTSPTSTPVSPSPSTDGGVAEAGTDWLGTAQQGLGAAAAGYSSFVHGRTMGMSNAEAGVTGAGTAVGAWYGDPYSMSAIFAYQSMRGFFNEGRSTADDRKNGAISGASTGAAMGAMIGGPVGAAIGASIGATVGTLSKTGKHGKSREQAHRDMYRSALVQSGIFENFGSKEHKHMATYQLADGQYYDVGVDGSGSRAKDINGKNKTFYNKSMIAEGDKVRDSGEMNPYDIDYTCNMDYTGSLLLAPLNALGLGGSNTRDSGEYSQMLGYMTNAVTSNTGREFTKENFNKMVSNIKAGYERVGINDKDGAMAALGLSYMMGNLTDDDFNSFKLAVDILYSNNGYNKAQTLMEQLDRGDQAKAEVIDITSEQQETTEPKPIQTEESIMETEDTSTSKEA
jgi:hypothetical protein